MKMKMKMKAKTKSMKMTGEKTRLARLFTLLALVGLSSAFGKPMMVVQFSGRDCKGDTLDTKVGSAHREVPFKNETQSMFFQTANNGILRWYGFAASVEGGTGCYGEPIGRLYTPCANVDNFTDKGLPEIKCMSYCNAWLGKTHPDSCAAIGITD